MINFINNFINNFKTFTIMGRPNKGAGMSGPKPPVGGPEAPNDGTQYGLGNENENGEGTENGGEDETPTEPTPEETPTND